MGGGERESRKGWDEVEMIDGYKRAEGTERDGRIWEMHTVGAEGRCVWVCVCVGAGRLMSVSVQQRVKGGLVSRNDGESRRRMWTSDETPLPSASGRAGSRRLQQHTEAINLHAILNDVCLENAGTENKQINNTSGLFFF